MARTKRSCIAITKTTPTHHTFLRPIIVEVVKADRDMCEYDARVVEVTGVTINIKEINVDMVIEELRKPAFEWRNDFRFDSFVMADFYAQVKAAIAGPPATEEAGDGNNDAGAATDASNDGTDDSTGAGPAPKDTADEEAVPGPAAGNGPMNPQEYAGINDDRSGKYYATFDLAFIERHHKTLLVAVH